MPAPSTPSFTTPAQAGALSNRRGANLTTDALALTAKYVNTSANSVAGTVRVTATRVASGGTAESGEQAWDTAWVGNPTLNNLTHTGRAQTSAFVYNGRLYISNGGIFGQIQSAPVSGASVGMWRDEVTPPTVVRNNATTWNINYIQNMCRIRTTVWANVNASNSAATTNFIYTASINPDGTLTAWTQYFDIINGWQIGLLVPFDVGLSGSPYSSAAKPPAIIGVGGDAANGASNDLTVVLVNPDGSPPTTGMTVQTHLLPANRLDHAGGISSYGDGTLWVMGGNDGTNAVATVYRALVDTTQSNLASIVAPWTTDTPLPAVRTGGQLVINDAIGNSNALGGTANNTGRLYYIGGSSTVSDTTATNTIYSAQAYTGGGNISAWTTETNGLSGNTRDHGSALSDTPVFTGGTNVSLPIITVGGANSGGSINTVRAHNTTLTTGATLAEVTGQGTALATSNMGTGGSVVTNSDGSQSVTFDYLGFGASANLRFSTIGFSDGDQIQYSIQFTDNLGGIPSPIGYTIVKIGQAPTITSASPANASTPAGAFTASFNYNAGAGGGNETSYRVQIEQPSGTSILDSGTIQGVANSYATRAGFASTNTPIPANAQTGAVTFLATSTDIPMAMDPGGTSSGTSASTLTDSTKNWTVNYFAGAIVRSGTSFGVVASNTSTVLTLTAYGWYGPTPASGLAYSLTAANLVIQRDTTTFTGSAPGTPTAVTAVADSTNGLVTVGWTSGVNTVTNRIWYRPSGTSAWLLAKDNVTSTGSAQTFQLVEPLALNQLYDFSVSGVSADPVEGSRSSAVTNVIIQPMGGEMLNHFETGGYHAMLSVVGNGPTQHAPLWVTDGKVQIDRDIAAEVALLFGATAPSARYGVYSYRTVNLKLTQRLQDIAGMDSVLAAVLTGSTLCYRDIFNGIVMYCVLPAKRQDTEDLYYEKSLQLVETNFVFTP